MTSPAPARDADEWLRVRFTVTDVGDYRPINFPPPGPYWCTGYNSDDEPIIVAYVKNEDQITEFWPDATNIDVHETNATLQFTSRFAKPPWWEDIEEGRTQ